VVPPRLRENVMQAWDRKHAHAKGWQPPSRLSQQALSRALGWAIIVVATALVIVAMLPHRDSTSPLEERTAIAAQPLAAEPAIAPQELPGRNRTTGSPARVRSRAPVADIPPPAVESGGYVIVPEPLGPTTSLQVVRVRMSRAGLASLGLAIVDPEAEGLVDVDMLVGDDGIARVIRRAAAASDGETWGGR
jgi:hypothetical protein